jgi:hypothetical protein
MSTAKRAFAAVAQIVGTSDGYVTLSSTTEIFSSNIDLETEGYEGCHIIVEVNFDATPTDDVDVKVYGSLDGTNYDDTPMTTRRIDKGTDPNQITVIVTGVAHCRLGIVQTGGTDSHDVRSYRKPWNWDIS